MFRTVHATELIGQTFDDDEHGVCTVVGYTWYEDECYCAVLTEDGRTEDIHIEDVRNYL